jgi:hypothetical protein
LPSAEWIDDDPDSPPPPKPGGIDENLWFDVSPLRPDAFGEQQAMPWSQATRDQITNRDAIDDVRQEAQGYGRLISGQAGEVG